MGRAGAALHPRDRGFGGLARAVRCGADGPQIAGQTGGRLFPMLGWIFFGLIVGVIAKLLMPGRDPGGFIITILLGIAGAMIGGFIGRALGLYAPGQPAGFLM